MGAGEDIADREPRTQLSPSVQARACGIVAAWTACNRRARTNGTVARALVRHVPPQHEAREDENLSLRPKTTQKRGRVDQGLGQRARFPDGEGAAYDRASGAGVPKDGLRAVWGVRPTAGSGGTSSV